ncbi:hypothetical protein [Streptomyces sp. NPDC057552]|uniref:hypothetical protein n=1 Tax=Streptomyces sp. NPDC057552 TaxID=3350537 RepID=UPI003692CD7D
MAVRKGFFAGIRAWLWGDPDTPESERPGRAEARRASAPGGLTGTSVEPVRAEATAELPFRDVPMTVASRDDVFEFHLTPHFHWRSTEMTFADLRERAAALEETARRELVRRVWGIARAHDPADPVAAEEAINRRLGEVWCYTDDKGMISCRASVRVRSDPALRDHVRPFRLTELRMREEHRLGELKAQHAAALTEIWIDVVTTLEMTENPGAVERQFLAPFVAPLADRDFAATMKALRETRRNGTQALAQVLGRAAKDHDQVGLYEFSNAYDKALSSFCKQMGVSPFAWVTSETAGTGAADADPRDGFGAGSGPASGSGTGSGTGSGSTGTSE